jgi:hypothetical protein
MTNTPSAYPLQWPAGRPRTPANRRQYGQFKSGDRRVTRAQATDRLRAEVKRLGGLYLTISSDLVLRQDGQPHLGKAEPADPGVVAFFTLKGASVALPCDTYSSLAQNIAALAGHIEATRRIERYGVVTASETLQAFTALPPPPGSSAPAARPWREVLHLKPDFPFGLDSADAEMIVQARWKKLATAAHPDTGGSAASMAALNAARDEALACVRS